MMPYLKEVLDGYKLTLALFSCQHLSGMYAGGKLLSGNSRADWSSKSDTLICTPIGHVELQRNESVFHLTKALFGDLEFDLKGKATISQVNDIASKSGMSLCSSRIGVYCRNPQLLNQSEDF